MDSEFDQLFSLKDKKIWVAGHNGMVGSAMVRRLQREECFIFTAGRDKFDLRRQENVERWVKVYQPDVIVMAAAKVGGIAANAQYPAEFLYDNLMIEANIIHAAHHARVKKLLFLGSSCIYPQMAKQPITEDALLTGPLEPTNEAYAIAKIAGVKLCESYRAQYGCDFISAMPCNLYGPGDNFNPETAHVIPALLRKAYEARRSGLLQVWGSGKPRREFMHVDDLADALVFMLKHYSGASPVNIGSGKDISIADLVAVIAEVTGFDGRIAFDSARPDGTPRKLMDSSRIAAGGWKPSIGLTAGLESTFRWYMEHPGLQRAA